MDIKDMRAFYAIVEEGNISHAAGRLAVAQPALSRQMKRLESALGVKLFERGSRRIRLTEAGRVLKERVEQILGLVDGTVREIQDVGEGTAGEPHEIFGLTARRRAVHHRRERFVREHDGFVVLALDLRARDGDLDKPVVEHVENSCALSLEDLECHARMRLVKRRQKPRHEICARACDRADAHLARRAFAHILDLAHRAVDKA